MAEKVRPIFIYLAVIAVVLGMLGISMIIGDITGKAIVEQEIKDIYNKAELTKHNNQEDCWICVDSKVYDITLFLQIYPDKTLKEKCGEEVGEEFFSLDTGEILEQYEIGILR